MLRLVLALLLAAPAAEAADETVLGGLSQSRVSITADFDGSELLVFGAVRRLAPPAGPPLSVVVTLTGPPEEVTVRRKSRVLGIWVNTDSVTIDSAPSFYAVATSGGTLDEIVGPVEDIRHRISAARAIRSVGMPAEVQSRAGFADALLRLRRAGGHYQANPGSVEVTEDTLFRTTITLPADLTEGNYRTRIFLVRDGAVIDEFSRAIRVGKVGLERWLFVLATEQPLIYGALALAIAVVAGWGAATVARHIRTG